MKIGIAVRRDTTDYFVHQSYIHMLKKKKHSFDFITLETDLTSFDGFLLPGGYDLDPKLYHEKNYASNHIDEEMDKLDFRIIEYAAQTKKPLLGICRGIQSINVYFGGTLKQDIRNHMDENH
ncbi:MAG: gamma-glutamyl-gamma-aminobutyrate hydrolase family protein, partial [Anaeroplasmataceae bacterium]|nr:gamma-glutamyl-gamma-aminobutyrate hydrolase family protein [Anaeroplasmataceae bacterium]